MKVKEVASIAMWILFGVLVPSYLSANSVTSASPKFAFSQERYSLVANQKLSISDGTQKDVDRVKLEKIAAEKARQERLAAEKKAKEEAEKAKRIAEEKARQEKLAAEKAKRIAEEKANQERLAAERKAKEEAEKARRAVEEKARQERLAAEKQAKEAAEKARQEKLAAERAAEEAAAKVAREAERQRNQLEDQVISARLDLERQAKKFAKEQNLKWVSPRWPEINSKTSLKSAAELKSQLSVEGKATVAQMVQKALENSPEHAETIKTWKMASQKDLLDVQDIELGQLGKSYPFAKKAMDLTEQTVWHYKRLEILSGAKVEMDDLEDQVLNKQAFGLATDLDRLAIESAKARWNSLYSEQKQLVEGKVQELSKLLNQPIDPSAIISTRMPFSSNPSNNQLQQDLLSNAKVAYEYAKQYGAYMQLDKSQVVRLHEDWRDQELKKLDLICPQ